MEIDAIEQGARDPPLITTHGTRITDALTDRISEVSTRTWIERRHQGKIGREDRTPART
jgi:hypothetical protein